MKKQKEQAIKRGFRFFYLLIHIPGVALGVFLFLFSVIGLILFPREASFRINQLVAMIVSLIDSIVLFIPVHKTTDTKKLTFLYYLLTAIIMLNAGLLMYPLYVITFVLLFGKLFTVMLRLFSLLKLAGKTKTIFALQAKGVILLAVVALISFQGMAFLRNAYGRKIPPRNTPLITPAPTPNPKTSLPDLGFVIPGKPTRIWKTVSPPHITIIDTLIAGTGGMHGTLFIHDGTSLMKLAQVTAIEFANGKYSMGSFGIPVISPDYKYLFIEEQGYEGGRTHAFALRNGRPLDRSAYPNAPGVMHWSEGGKCILGEQYEYGDRQALQLGVENGNGYTMYPYDKSVITAMGIEDLSVFWIKGDACQALLTFTSGLTVNPKGFGEDLDEEILFDMTNGPVRRNRWKALFNFESSQKPIKPIQIYP